MSILIQPSASAGFVSLMGQIEKASGETLNLPEGQLNIGGNGKGFLLRPEANWDPLTHNDGSFSSLSVGTDVYVYAVTHASGVAQYISSVNSTYPDGYTEMTSRKVGGFHVGRIRPITERYNAAYIPVVQIIPNSCWDLKHRPACSPEGMVEISPTLWGDIYLSSVIAGAWPEVIFGSRFDAIPVRSTGGYSEIDLHRGLHAAGKREPTFEEWLLMSYGAPQGSDANNDTAWTRTSNTGPCNTGFVAKSVSCSNCVDTVGNLWERLAYHYDWGGTYAWSTAEVNTGQDAAFPRGSVYRATWRGLLAGGQFHSGALCGARTLNTGAAPWSANGFIGVRGVCASISA